MDAARMDRLARAFGSRSSRRAAIGAALGFAGAASAGHEANAAKCGKKKRCGRCQQCKKGKCKRQKDGAVCGSGGVCQSGGCVCPDQRKPCAEGLCCGKGQACDRGSCRVCSLQDTCDVAPPQCGIASDGTPCFCVVSIENHPVCASLDLADCIACDSDAACTDHQGRPAVCIDTRAQSCGAVCQATDGKVCMPLCA